MEIESILVENGFLESIKLSINQFQTVALQPISPNVDTCSFPKKASGLTNELKEQENVCPKEQEKLSPAVVLEETEEQDEEPLLQFVNTEEPEHYFWLNRHALLREGKLKTSKFLITLHQGTIVYLIRKEGNRGKIRFPVFRNNRVETETGWCTLTLSDKKKMLSPVPEEQQQWARENFKTQMECYEEVRKECYFNEYDDTYDNYHGNYVKNAMSSKSKKNRSKSLKKIKNFYSASRPDGDRFKNINIERSRRENFDAHVARSGHGNCVMYYRRGACTFFTVKDTGIELTSLKDLNGTWGTHIVKTEHFVERWDEEEFAAEKEITVRCGKIMDIRNPDAKRIKFHRLEGYFSVNGWYLNVNQISPHCLVWENCEPNSATCKPTLKLFWYAANNIDQFGGYDRSFVSCALEITREIVGKWRNQKEMVWEDCDNFAKKLNEAIKNKPFQLGLEYLQKFTVDIRFAVAKLVSLMDMKELEVDFDRMTNIVNGMDNQYYASRGSLPDYVAYDIMDCVKRIGDMIARWSACAICCSSAKEVRLHSVNCYTKCRMCKGCLASYMNNAASRMKTEINCPGMNCRCRWDDTVITKLEKLIPAEVQNWRDAKWKGKLKQCEDFRFCPQADCKHGFVLPTACCYANNIVCPKCDYDFCPKCYAPNHSEIGTCMEFLALVTGKDIESEVTQENTKQCPFCLVWIEKNDGCSHMTCDNCLGEFCWLCMGDWKLHGYNRCPEITSFPVERPRFDQLLPRKELGYYTLIRKAAIRLQASLDSFLTNQLNGGTFVEVLAFRGNRAQIRYNGSSRGWCSVVTENGQLLRYYEDQEKGEFQFGAQEYQTTYANTPWRHEQENRFRFEMDQEETRISMAFYECMKGIEKFENIKEAWEIREAPVKMNTNYSERKWVFKRRKNDLSRGKVNHFRSNRKVNSRHNHKKRVRNPFGVKQRWQKAERVEKFSEFACHATAVEEEITLEIVEEPIMFLYV